MHAVDTEVRGTNLGSEGEPPPTGKQIVREMIEQVWHRGNLAYIRTAFSPAFVGSGPSSSCRDLVGYRLHVAEVRAAFPDIRIDVMEQVEEHGAVVSRYRMRGTHLGHFMGVAPTAQRATTEGMTIHRMVRGRIAEAWSCWDVIGLLRDLGVSVPEPPHRLAAGAA